MIFKQFIGVVPPLIVAEGDKVQVKCCVVVKGVPANPKKPIALCPSSNSFWGPVEAREDSFKEVDLHLEHFLGQSLEGAMVFLKSGLILDREEGGFVGGSPLDILVQPFLCPVHLLLFQDLLKGSD